MRHNQNARRMRGGRGNGHNGGGHHHNGQPGRRVNPRVQTFDSNGPDVRIRGTAYQINEKYVTLARDATSAGDRVLAESYLQHAEHYQRFINEMTEEMNQYQQQNPQNQPQPPIDDHGAQPPADGHAAAPETARESLSDLDQGFLVGPRNGNGNGREEGNAADGGEQPRLHDGQGRRAARRGGESEAV
ncbi:MAG: DUF4167 domain-containing protein [Alphaproteobacteria bacterium]|nr:DUF4167 domain-containing protein [Alphaproteobacteria bacterium]MDE2335851.1 DUF4167 domain-containing protein [Alphaproteobacteria bacterium]